MRSTAFTFYADDGETVREITIRQDGSTFRMLTNPDDIDVGDPWSFDEDRSAFIGLTAARRVAERLIREDGRRTARGMSMFVIPSRAFRNTRGQRVGHWYTFADMLAKVLTYSDEDWGTETQADRVADRDAILAQRGWEE